VARPTEWLKNARKRAGYGSQKALADVLGVSRGAVGNWENGTDRPSMVNAERLAVVLKRQRSEVLAKFGYPIGGGDPLSEMPVALPPEWLLAIRAEIAAGVADGIAQAVAEIRREGREGPEQADGGSRPRRSA